MHHQHGAAHEHGTLVHRFEHADDWVAQFDDPARDAWQKPDAVVGAMQIEQGMTVADLGAGTGYFEPHLSRAVGATGQVLALDVEPDMVRYLIERAQREHLGNVRAVLARSDDPALAEQSCDRILIVDTWHHIPEREKYAQKLRAALRPGGRVYVVDFTREAAQGPPPEFRVPPQQVVEELTRAGLQAQISSLTLPDQYVVMATLPK
jgi:ubiquinone/menaquinone biosynthesis C-methylase UbiE